MRFYATGCILQVAGDFTGTDKATASRVTVKTSRAIASLNNQYIRVPASREEISMARQGFYNISRFPRCIGAIDCTHIKIQSLDGEDPEIFRNRKGFFFQCAGCMQFRFDYFGYCV